MWEGDDGGDIEASQLVGKCPQPHHYYALNCYVACMLHDSIYRLTVLKHLPNGSNNSTHLVKVFYPHVLGELLPCAH